MINLYRAKYNCLDSRLSVDAQVVIPGCHIKFKSKNLRYNHLRLFFFWGGGGGGFHANIKAYFASLNLRSFCLILMSQIYMSKFLSSCFCKILHSNGY